MRESKRCGLSVLTELRDPRIHPPPPLTFVQPPKFSLPSFRIRALFSDFNAIKRGGAELSLLSLNAFKYCTQPTPLKVPNPSPFPLF